MKKLSTLIVLSTTILLTSCGGNVVQTYKTLPVTGESSVSLSNSGKTVKEATPLHEQTAKTLKVVSLVNNDTLEHYDDNKFDYLKYIGGQTTEGIKSNVKRTVKELEDVVTLESSRKQLDIFFFQILSETVTNNLKSTKTVFLDRSLFTKDKLVSVTQTKQKLDQDLKSVSYQQVTTEYQVTIDNLPYRFSQQKVDQYLASSSVVGVYGYRGKSDIVYPVTSGGFRVWFLNKLISDLVADGKYGILQYLSSTTSLLPDTNLTDTYFLTQHKDILSSYTDNILKKL